MRGRRVWWVGGTAVLLVLALAAGVTVVLRSRADDARRQTVQAATRFLAAWSAQRYADLDGLSTGGTPSTLFRSTDERLKVTKVTATPGRRQGDAVGFTARLELAGLGTFAYTGSLTVRDTPAGRRVVAAPSAYHPALREGLRLDRTRALPPRGQLLDRAGRALRPLSRDLAGNVLGDVGPAPRSTARVVQGEPTGLNGLERALDERLGGTAGGQVRLVDAAGAPVQVLQDFPSARGTDVQTTLDADLQGAAERALVGLPARAALVAVDAPTGEVRAVANSPLRGLPPAFSSYAPGSTFKIVTATAALQNGASLQTPLDCPPTIAVGGRSFANYEGESLGRIDLLRAFTVSCNTAFIGLSRTLPGGALAAAARLYGFGRTDLLPFGAEGGSALEPAGPVEAAADAIGQGRVEASPLLMATVAAAVDDGTWRQPKLVPGDAATTPLPAQVLDPLRQMMRSVVTSGTGRAADLPGTPVFGKTGTAEYGTANPPLTHAWFVGFRGRLAFAVFVETGASGGTVAAPVAARFLAAVPG